MSQELQTALLFLAAPTVMCIVLAGIHCYLGLHVLARGVIFVDLSLAQVAAFGSTLALLLDFEHHSVESYFISLGATFLASWLFALARRHESFFSQEAIIGIIYAMGSAAVVLLVDRMAHGAEHIKNLLVGQLLWVSWKDVGITTAIYSAVGLIHYFYRANFVAASFGGTAVSRFWDFLFYSLFGVIITSSVSVVGVLQVFAYLIVPSVVSALFFKSLQARLAFGWAAGVIVSIAGMAMSYVWDFPSGAFIVVCFTALPILLLIFWNFLPFRKFSDAKPSTS
jgi:zinc/manganese transport system permease protein